MQVHKVDEQEKLLTACVSLWHFARKENVTVSSYIKASHMRNRPCASLSIFVRPSVVTSCNFWSFQERQGTKEKNIWSNQWADVPHSTLDTLCSPCRVITRNQRICRHVSSYSRCRLTFLWCQNQTKPYCLGPVYCLPEEGSIDMFICCACFALFTVVWHISGVWDSLLRTPEAESQRERKKIWRLIKAMVGTAHNCL